jgi:hypothetical protein
VRRPLGVGLVEVAVALLVLSVGWAALVALQRSTLRIALETGLRDEARWTLQAVCDSLVLAGSVGAGRRDMPWGWVEWRPELDGVRLEAWTGAAGPVAVLWTASRERP